MSPLGHGRPGLRPFCRMTCPYGPEPKFQFQRRYCLTPPGNCQEGPTSECQIPIVSWDTTQTLGLSGCAVDTRVIGRSRDVLCRPTLLIVWSHRLFVGRRHFRPFSGLRLAETPPPMILTNRAAGSSGRRSPNCRRAGDAHVGRPGIWWRRVRQATASWICSYLPGGTGRDSGISGFCGSVTSPFWNPYFFRGLRARKSRVTGTGYFRSSFL